MSRRSRLNRRLENQSRKTLILSVVGIFLIGVILLKFGIPLLADLGFLSSQIIPKKESTKKNNNEVYLSPPSINPLPEATNSEGIEVSGVSTTGETVSVYLNGSQFDEVEIESDGSFNLLIKLSEGTNIVKAKSVEGDKESDFSESVNIDYLKNPPDLTIESPSDGETTKESNFNVRGKTDPSARVSVNGFRAIVNSNGDFSYKLALREGENEVKIVAEDEAGNKTEKIVKLNYSP